MTNSDLPPIAPIVDARNPSGELLVHPDEPGASPAEPVAVEPEAEYPLKELAREFGELAKPSPDAGGFYWRHRVAATVHGWDRYEYNYQKPLTLTRADYEAALKAVEKDQVHTPAVRN